MSDPAPIPSNTKSHLQSLFDKFYSSYSRDPIPAPAIQWSNNSGSAYLKVDGVTAVVVMTNGGNTKQEEFNLVNDGLGNKPTLNDFEVWLNERFTSFFVSGFTIGWYPGYTDTSLSALVLVEGYVNSGYPIPVATAPNYTQLRVMSLVFDLLASDTENFFTHLSIAGLDAYVSDPKIGIWLDWVGGFYGIKRFIRSGSIESNDSYRRRILRMLSQPRENNTAIANIVGQSVGVWDILVVDYRLFWALLIVFGSLADPSIPMPLAKSIAPAGIRFTGIDIPGTTGDIRGAVAGRVRAGNSGIDYSSSRPKSFQRREGWTASNYSDYWSDEIALPLSGVFVVLK